MWVRRFFAFALAALPFAACGGKSIHTVGGEAGDGPGPGCELTECGDECVDLSSDPRHCGDCRRRCDSNEICQGGNCVGREECVPPTVDCGLCVDLRFDQYHCGACGFSCGLAEYCDFGSCISQCPNGQCGDVCVDLYSDPGNCGSCGYACQSFQFCSGGRCVDACGGTICNGQCVDLSSDPFNCGRCGITCYGDCVSGSCQIACPSNMLYCNGVCVDWRVDVENCGGCNIHCANGQECIDGRCVSPCPTGTYCNGTCVDLSSDPIHCGSCNAPCNMPNRCVGGSCIAGTCGDRIVQQSEEADPPPGPLMSVPLDSRTCRYDFSGINQWYCNGTCGNWGGPDGCDQLDADAFCKLKMDNPRSTAIGWSTTRAMPAPGVCCPPPEHAPGALGCTNIGVLSSRGVNINVSVHPTNLFSTHQGGTVITNLVCTDP